MKMWYIHTTEYYSAIKKRNLTICNDVATTRGYYAKQNKSIRERQLSYDVIHMWNLRNKIGSQGKGGKTEWEEIREGDK